jgi:hypothetical protein
VLEAGRVRSPGLILGIVIDHVAAELQDKSVVAAAVVTADSLV